jgi:hypothetical protein
MIRITAALLLLTAPIARAQSPDSPDAGAPVAETTNLPSTYTHPLGFSIRHPASWQPRDFGGTTALIPDDAPQLTGGPGEAHALAAMQAPPDIDLAERMTAEMSKAFPGLSATAEPERKAQSVTLRYGSAAGNISATVRATVKGQLLILMVSIGTADALARHDSLAESAFGSITLTPRAVDQSIVGSWTNSSSYSSTGFSMASSKTYTLRADGTYTFSSQLAGGTADVSTDTGPSQSRGIWAARDTTLTLVDSEGNAVTRTYRIVDGHLLTFDAHNKRTIWSR